MNKEIARIVEERSENLCELCEGNYMVQFHHIISGKGKRKECETEQSVIALCWDCHHGDFGVHGMNGHQLELKLKLGLQGKYFDMGKTDDKVRKLMGGKIY